MFFSKIRSLHRKNSTLRWIQTLQARKHEVQCICWGSISPFAEIARRCGEIQPDPLPRAKSCYFSAKSDRCDSRTQRSNGSRRYKRCERGSMFKMHSLGGVCQDRAVLRRNPIRSVASQDPIVENRENSMVFTFLTHKRTLKNSFFCDFMCVVANFDESGIIGIHPCAITSHSLGKRFMAKRATTNILGGRGVKESILAVAPGGGQGFP